jgi:hypothetical protein
MEYKAVPFTATITRNDTSGRVANQVQSIIDHYVAEGWEYMQMESVDTSVAPTGGCFGFGGQPGFTTSFQILIFKR